jgi:Lysyl oxidase
MRAWLGLVGVLATTAVCVRSASGALPNALLPDLDERAPLAVSVRWGGPPGKLHPRLVFTSSVENVGFGPLMVEGRRPSTRMRTLSADQLVRLRSGGFERFEQVGRIRYNVSPSHSHWHLQPFEQYELRTVDGRRIVRDHKSGFCLTNDYRSPLATLGPRATGPVDKSDCGRNKPGARHVLEGIPVGWGDLYIPAKEGQYIDISGLPYTDYVIVHRVNARRLLHETNYANNASSMRIRLVPPATPTDLPGVIELQSCDTGADC